MAGHAVAAIAAVGALGLGLMVHVLRYAYRSGRTDHRLDCLEKAQGDTGEVHGVLSALTATVEALKESVERLDRALERINSRVFNPRES